MTGLDIMLSQLQAEAKAEADSRLAAAREEADQLLAQADAEAESGAELIARQAEEEAARHLERTRSSADRKRRMILLQAKQEVIAEVLKKAYEKMMEAKDTMVTDDAMVVEKYEKYPIKLLKGSYENIKITTPEDLVIAKGLLDRKEDKNK